MGSLRNIKSQRLAPADNYTEEIVDDWQPSLLSRIGEIAAYFLICFLGVVVSGMCAAPPILLYAISGMVIFLIFGIVAFVGCMLCIFPELRWYLSGKFKELIKRR